MDYCRVLPTGAEVCCFADHQLSHSRLRIRFPIISASAPLTRSATGQSCLSPSLAPDSVKRAMGIQGKCETQLGQSWRKAPAFADRLPPSPSCLAKARRTEGYGGHAGVVFASLREVRSQRSAQPPARDAPERSEDEKPAAAGVLSSVVPPRGTKEEAAAIQ